MNKFYRSKKNNFRNKKVKEILKSIERRFSSSRLWDFYLRPVILLKNLIPLMETLKV